MAARIGSENSVTQVGAGVAVGVGSGIRVEVAVGVAVGVKVVVTVGVLVAKGLGTADRLLHPDNKKTPITPHTRIVPQTFFEIL
jgi:hypothetical protein